MSWIWKQSDKRQHVIAGLLIGFFVTFFSMYFVPLGMAMFIGLIVGGTTAYAKEERDAKDPKHHTADYRDAFATFLGTIIGCISGGFLAPDIYELLENLI